VTATVSRGDVVLVPFPFTDLSRRKVRPALVVNTVGEDVLLAFISSVVPAARPAPTDCVLGVAHPDFSATGLKAAATFKLAKLVCLHHTLVLRKLGHVTPAIQRELDVRLARAVGLP
jgi:mRNA interferase MazF